MTDMCCRSTEEARRSHLLLPVESARVHGKPRICLTSTWAPLRSWRRRCAAAGWPPDRGQNKLRRGRRRWGVLEDLGVAGIIDEVTGPRRLMRALRSALLGAGGAEQAGRPVLKRASRTGGHHGGAPSTKISASVLDHRRFWDAMHAVTDGQLEEVSHRIALRIVDVYELDCSSVALDMTNFATFIATPTPRRRSPSGQGQAKAHRPADRWGCPWCSPGRAGPADLHAYPGDKPDVTEFPAMISQPRRRTEATTAAIRSGATGADMTVVFDAARTARTTSSTWPAAGCMTLGRSGHRPPGPARPPASA